MRREDLMNPDLLSEVVLLGTVALMVGTVAGPRGCFHATRRAGMAGVWGIAQIDLTTRAKRADLDD